jgi:hypothetical protein
VRQLLLATFILLEGCTPAAPRLTDRRVAAEAEADAFYELSKACQARGMRMAPVKGTAGRAPSDYRCEPNPRLFEPRPDPNTIPPD